MSISFLTGEICGGHCCSAKTELDVLKKSVKTFEGLIKIQLKNLKGLWESTYNIYKDHVLDLSHQSENKTLTLFSTVYRRMSPLSRAPITELYKSIRSYIQSHKPLSHDSGGISNDELEAVIEKFFRNLFPLAYHHAVHSQNAAATTALSQDTNEDVMASRDFHVDYKNCLINSYESLQPFGEIPYSISRSLVQSVSSASTLLRALQRGADVLSEIENLPIESSLSTKCQHALLKMNYCAACKGHNYHHIKPCNGYCSNVMRGCLAQLMGGFDTDWASFSETIERLMTLVRNKDGIETVIKNLDGKLSEAIMHAMTNGPDLEKKVHKSCGQPSIRHNERAVTSQEQLEGVDKAPSLEKRQEHHSGYGNKWPTPPDTEMLQFLTELDKSKSFSLQIATSYCEDDRYQKQDRNCWNGDHLGDYTHKVMDMQLQKYNPEVPIDQSKTDNENSRLHKINDQLITMKNFLNKQMTHLSRSDADKMFSDMAEDGSGGYHAYDDDEDYDMEMSGSGSHPLDISPETPVIGVTSVVSPKNTPTSGVCRLRISLLSILVLPSFIVILFNKF
ncbi:hypothetical protein PVAND_007267 [Polypedilum vanderplanki]|uniref:Uncharacterized protein n=1 Tax=Polypedilum vanderplanki TaxID=319348 RepID=A0A9J6C6A6_POLVA|nr:hypothetical protein PVAND_007267 [Polypedilum vanderplanki]